MVRFTRSFMAKRTARLRFGASFELPVESRRSIQLSITAAFPIAALVACVSLVGIFSAPTYARETPSWAAQAVGQDWVDLVVAVPLLAITGFWAQRGSRRAFFLLAASLLYTVYEFVIYGFDVRFNALFLAYCATLGLTFFALAGLYARVLREDVSRWYEEKPPVRIAGTFLIAVGLLFTAAWLGDIVPALVHGTPPEAIREAQTPTNPVHVLDLSVILPLHVVAGVALLQRRKLGYALAPVLLGFEVLMALSIAGMSLVMRRRGVEASLVVAIGMAVLAASSMVVLAPFLVRLRR